MKKSRRQELDHYMNDGSLRACLERGNPRLSPEAMDLVIDIVSRYVQPKRVPAWKRKATKP